MRESEKILRDLQRVAGIGSYSLDIGKGEWAASDVMDEVFGIDKNYPRTTEGWLALVHPEEREMMAAYFRDEVLGRGLPFDKEYRIVRPSGEAVRWVHGSGKLEFDDRGHPVKMFGTIQDITKPKEVELTLKESKNLLQLLIEQAPLSLAMFDCEMRYLAASRVHRERFDLNEREFIGHSYYEMIPSLPQHWREAHRRCLAGEKVRKENDYVELPDGTKRWLQWELHPWYTGGGAVGGVIAFSLDITERKKAEEHQRLAACVFTHAHEGIMITDAQGNILDANDMFTEITGYTREEVLGRNPRLLKSGRQKKKFYAEMWGALAGQGSWSGVIWNRDKNGRIFAEILTISAVPDEHGEVQQYVALFADITKVKEQEQQLEKIAHYDTITGLPNRMLMIDRLKMAIAQLSPLKPEIAQSRRGGKMMAVVYLDLDWFKEINDRHGHDVGDQLLNAVARRLRSAMRKGDTLARVGGDEFVGVMLELENRDTCVTMLDRLIEAAAQPIQIGDLSLHISASLGATLYPQAQEVAADQLIRQADQAMYQAKLAGKNQYYIFDAEQDRDVRGRLASTDRIRHALGANEFVLYYQPQVNMREGKVLGVETLLRWQHPDRGLLLPGVFLPQIKDDSLIVEIDNWVIDNALAQMKSWHSTGLYVPVSVNVAAQQLRQPNFVERLGAMLAAHPGIHPSFLTLEIVETCALENIENTSQILEDCRKLGVSFALDDFGTGYSSLSYLRRVPAEVLKIDLSFVRDVLTDPDDITIIEGIISLASAFRRKVVAEGVETVEHGLMLLRMGCELAQGSAIAHPMPAQDIPDWIAGWSPNPSWIDVLPSNTKERRLLHAAVVHRFLVVAVESYLKGEPHSSPQLDLDQCPFSTWLAENALGNHGMTKEIQDLDVLHRKIHRLAEDIVQSTDHGPGANPMNRMDELHEINRAFISQLVNCKCG